ncbi:hypothetical protein HZS_642 [Henneguya salminicola]|nr:hypothetical protein HZS_642 [Henneguya salminicola]
MFGLEYSRTIFHEFHKFESEFGGLNSCLELEDRILQKHNLEYEEIRLIVDRYNFSYDQPVNKKYQRDIDADDVIQKSMGKNSLPDLNQMRPFKPIPIDSSPYNLPILVPGGVFPPPYKISEMMSQLPPPQNFEGPYLDIPRLVYMILNCIESQPSNIPRSNDNNISELNNNMETSNKNTKILDDLYRYRHDKNIIK